MELLFFEKLFAFSILFMFISGAALADGGVKTSISATVRNAAVLTDDGRLIGEPPVEIVITPDGIEVRY